MRTLIITALLTWVLNASAQEFGTHWVSYPLPDDSCEVLFRKTFREYDRPLTAQLTFASTGRLRVYVNERNITADVLFLNEDSTVTLFTYDITRYVRKGNNTIAVWYAPTAHSIAGKQLSLEYYGWRNEYVPFYHKADGTWQTRLLTTSYTTGEHEAYHRPDMPTAWKEHNYQYGDWQRPTGAPADAKETTATAATPLYRCRLQRTLRPVAVKADSLGLLADFGEYFYGTIRLTLRGARKGQKINVSPLLYTCDGSLDEQAYQHFHPVRQRYYLIEGDPRSLRRQITNIEGLEYQLPYVPHLNM